METLTLGVQIGEQVLLALQLPLELLGLHVADAPLLGLCDLVGVHGFSRCIF